MTTPEHAEALLSRIESRIEAFVTALSADEDIEVGDFEEIAQELCETVAAMPQDEALQFKPHFMALSEALDEISTVLTARREMLAKQLGGLETNTKAHAAYMKADSIKKPSEE